LAIGSEVVPYVKAEHDRTDFRCGEESLDAFLREQITQLQRDGGTRAYVLCEDERRVIGYYTLNMFSVESAEAPADMQKGKYAIPAVLLGRLAVDERYAGKGLGVRLLVDAFVKSVNAASLVGARMMVVDALHEQAAAFYVKQGFTAFEANPLKLYLPMQHLRRTLEVAGRL